MISGGTPWAESSRCPRELRGAFGEPPWSLLTDESPGSLPQIHLPVCLEDFLICSKGVLLHSAGFTHKQGFSEISAGVFCKATSQLGRKIQTFLLAHMANAGGRHVNCLTPTTKGRCHTGCRTATQDQPAGTRTLSRGSTQGILSIFGAFVTLCQYNHFPVPLRVCFRSLGLCCCFQHLLNYYPVTTSSITGRPARG